MYGQDLSDLEYVAAVVSDPREIPEPPPPEPPESEPAQPESAQPEPAPSPDTTVAERAGD